MEIEESARTRARYMIVTGYVVVAAGSLTTLIQWIADGALRFNSAFDVEEFAVALSSLAALVAWWFLAQVIAKIGSERQLVRKALVGLVVQQLLLASSAFAFISIVNAISWQLVAESLSGTGSLLISLGFLAMMLTYRGDAELPVLSDTPTNV
jgi:hypothetical protein